MSRKIEHNSFLVNKIYVLIEQKALTKKAGVSRLPLCSVQTKQ